MALAHQPQQAVDQRELIKSIVAGNAVERRRAVSVVERMDAENIGEELRAVVADALKTEARKHVDQYFTGRRGEPTRELEDPTLVAALIRIVANLKDPSTIPTLSEGLGFGSTARAALWGLGLQALPATLAAALSPQTMHYAVDDALITLRFMVEAPVGGAPAGPDLADIRRAAAQHLSGRPYFTTLWNAIDLAVVLQDPELLEIVQRLATDRREVHARGIVTPHIVDRTLKHAADRLAGSPPLPRPPVR